MLQLLAIKADGRLDTTFRIPLMSESSEDTFLTGNARKRPAALELAPRKKACVATDYPYEV